MLFTAVSGLNFTGTDVSGSSYKGHYIIQFDGTIRQSWADCVKGCGAEILDYVPDNCYEIRADAKALDDIMHLPFVSLSTEYPISRKISPDIVGNDVMITLMGTETLDDSLQELAPFINSFQEGSTGSGYLIKCTLRDAVFLERIASIRDVHYIEPYFQESLHGEIGSQILGGGMWYYDNDANVNTPYRVLDDHGAYVNQLGWTGAGVRIAIADTGVGDGTTPNAGHNDLTGRVVGGYDFGTGGWLDQHGHGTHCIGLAAGDTYNGNGVTYAGYGPYYVAQGLASDSTIYAEQIFEGSSGSWVGPADYKEIVYQGYAGGAQIQTNSWGSASGGAYGAADTAYDQAVRDASTGTAGCQQIIAFVSAGNSGSALNTIGSPGNAKNVITVGGVENYAPDASSYGNTYSTVADNPDVMYTSSSRGWTDDGRIKPDILTPGVNTLSLRSPSELTNNLFGFYSPDTRYQWCTGTSQSCPQAAGGGAVVYEWYSATYGTGPTPATVKALMINTAVDIGTKDIPNQNEGWGRMNIMPIIDPPAPFIIKQDPHELTTGVTDTYTFSYADPSEPLKITLAYTDRYAASGANPSLMNQVNLEVETPTGTIYHGNAFSGGWSSTANPPTTFDANQDGYDDRNNVECVFIPSTGLQAGDYIVRIIGTNVPADCDFDGANDQDYSLVIYNAAQDTSATATGPKGSSNQAAVTLTYSVTMTPSSVNLYYTKSTSAPYSWVLAGNDNTVDGSYSYTITAGSGTYGWLASAVGGTPASTEPSPPGNTVPPEASSYILDLTAPSAPSGLTVEHWAPSESATETRYMRSDEASVNGLTADVLGTAQTTTATSYTLPSVSTIYAGIRVWSRTVAGTETEITGGTPVAIASATSAQLVSATWSCPQRTLQDTDSIVVRMYGGGSSPPATLVEEFSTEQLGASQLDSGTWTVYYFLDERNNGDRIYWGSATYNSRIDGFSWSSMTNPLDHNTLNWTASTSPDLDHHNIYRASVVGGPYTLIDSVALGTNTYTDVGRGQADATLWWYRVRAVDAATNEETNTVSVQEPGVTDTPPTVTVNTPNGGESYDLDSTITITWSAADNNAWPSPSCWIYYDTDTNPTGQVLITSTVAASAGTYNWNAAGVPVGTYYIHIVVQDSAAQQGQDWSNAFFSIVLPPYDIDLGGIAAGSWAFVSFPIDISGDIGTILPDEAGGTAWDVAKWYDSSVKTWKSYRRGATTNTFTTINNKMGVWLHITANGGDQMLTTGVSGAYPTASVPITLNSGWNMVGYPSALSRVASVALTGTGATMVSVYSATTPYITDYTNLASVTMSHGHAYWVFVPSATVWNIGP